jgi:adenosylhomocysteine nucleosidase
MSILFVAAEAAELKPLAQRLEYLRKLSWPLDYAYEGIADGRRFILAAHGAGPELAMRAAEVAIRAVSAAKQSSSHLEAIVSTGYCGALDPALQIGDIVVATQVLDAATQELFPCLDPCRDRENAPVRGTVLSQNRIAINIEEKKQLFRQSGACAVEMESAGVALRSKRAGLPFYCIKVISDIAGESFSLDLNRMRTTEGRLARGKIIMHALARPNLVPGLLRLKRRTEEAAQVLGEFLVSCRISPDIHSPGE